MQSAPARFLELTRRRFRADVADVPISGPSRGPISPGTDPAVRRIVLTGGPGGGKSTAAGMLARQFADTVRVLPESATLLYRGGLPRGADPDGVRIAQETIYTLQHRMEVAHGLEHPEQLHVCDRGTIDGAAYWPDGPEAFFEAMGTSLEHQLGRYEAVIFMHTAATLPAAYDHDGTTRIEHRAEAMELDRRVRELYASHHQLIVIDSDEEFMSKIGQVVEVVEALLGDRSYVAARLGYAPHVS